MNLSLHELLSLIPWHGWISLASLLIFLVTMIVRGAIAGANGARMLSDTRCNVVGFSLLIACFLFSEASSGLWRDLLSAAGFLILTIGNVAGARRVSIATPPPSNGG